MKPHERILVALDTPNVDRAKAIADATAGSVGGVKLGLEFFNANGHEGVRAVVSQGTPLFLDLKFHDIPNTVAGAIRSVVPLGPSILNVHASGGEAMLRAARTAADETAQSAGIARPRLIGVTVLTSMDDSDLLAVGQRPPTVDQVVRLARLTQDCGLDGVVCSPLDIEAIRAVCGRDFVLVVPGIRPADSPAGDQKRVTTPAAAIAAGADYLVIGRAITAAPDPAAAARAIAEALG